MVDRGRAQDLNEVAKRFAESLADSYRLVYGQAAQSQSASTNVLQGVLGACSSNSGADREAGRANSQQLSEQAQRQRRPTRSSSILPSLATGRAPSKPPKAPRRGCAPSPRRPQDCWAPPPER